MSTRPPTDAPVAIAAPAHVDPTTRSREIRCVGDSHPWKTYFAGGVGLARGHPLTKTQAMPPARRTRSSYDPPYPLGRRSSAAILSLPWTCVRWLLWRISIIVYRVSGTWYHIQGGLRRGDSWGPTIAVLKYSLLLFVDVVINFILIWSS